MNISMHTLVTVLDLLVHLDKKHIATRVCCEAQDMTYAAYRFVNDDTKRFIDEKRNDEH